LSDAVLMIDVSGNIFYANPAAQKLFGLVVNAKKLPALSDILPESSPYRAQAMEVNEGQEKTLRVMTDTAFLPTELFSRPHIVITVSDNGRGIPEDALANVFNPFFTANKEGGTGLGLAISHRIVQRHLGLLTIENNPDVGVTATVRLPLSQN